MATIIREAGYTGSAETDFSNPNPVQVFGRVFVQLGTWDDANPPTFTAVATSAGNADMTAGSGSVSEPTVSSLGNFDITFPGEEDEYSGIGVFMYGVTPPPAGLAVGLTPPGWLELPFELGDSVQTIAPLNPTKSSSTLAPDFVYNETNKTVKASLVILNPNSDLGSINITGYGFESTANGFSASYDYGLGNSTILQEDKYLRFTEEFNLVGLQANDPQDVIEITGWVDWNPNWTRTAGRAQTASNLYVGQTTLFTLIQPGFEIPAFESTG